MATPILDRISCPADLKKLKNSQLNALAEEIRTVMVETTAKTGGHLAPSLGAVEIIIALHRALNCPEDKIVYDVGHQSYAHKLLTGRKDQFAQLRTAEGISGFPRIAESPYDSHDAGHASDALSIALGYALARDLDGEDCTIAALVGDASFVGGMSLEALNYIGHSNTPMVIILNDNGMSISSSVGGFASFLGKVRMSDRYTSLRDSVEARMTSRGKVGQFLMKRGNAAKESFKSWVLPGDTFFEGFGVTYIGPVDGHDISGMESIIRDAIELDGPVLIHAVTVKGKGYKPAEASPDTFHGVGPFELETGKVIKSASAAPNWTKVFANKLTSMADEHHDIVAITAAMPDGTGLSTFAKKHPGRFFDVGIAEENATAMAGSLALSGKVPFVAIYSTFAQRAFDQMMVNVALMNQHVVFCLDRAGLVGEDGTTHHGAFDLTYTRAIPGMTVLAPSDSASLEAALEAAYAMEGPVCIRYARGAAVQDLPGGCPDVSTQLSIARKEGDDIALLACGTMVQPALEAAQLLEEQGISARVVDMFSVKPLDADAVRDAAACKAVVTIEENSIAGGFGSAVLEALSEAGLSANIKRLGLPDGFVGQGKQAELRAQVGLDAQGIAASCIEVLNR